jgi:hypothetical protein
MQARHFAALLCLPLLGLSACVTQAPSVVTSRNPTYSTDLAHKAANCSVPSVTLTDGASTDAAMTTGGGGWCGIYVRKNDQPYGAGLLIQAPQKGAVYIHSVGDDTRVDYTPRAGTSGPDSFTVRFLPGDATMRVTVNGAPK